MLPEKLSQVHAVVTRLVPIRPLIWARGTGERRNNRGVVQTCVRAYVKSEYKPLVVDPGGSWGTNPRLWVQAPRAESVQCGGARGEVKKRKRNGPEEDSTHDSDNNNFEPSSLGALWCIQGGMPGQHRLLTPHLLLLPWP